MKIQIISFILFWFLAAPFAISAQTVYVTPSGKKFHKGNCRMVNNVSKSYSLNAAIVKRYTPCRTCNPHATANGIYAGTNTPKGSKPETVQCKGKTKNSKRCHHMTRLGNGYCFQHNPNK